MIQVRTSTPLASFLSRESTRLSIRSASSRPSFFIEPCPTSSSAVSGKSTTGLPLLLVQGWACCAADWGAIPKLLAAAGNRPVITYDPSGFGSSLATSGEYACTTAGLAEDCLSIVQAAGMSQVHILGISLGGTIAQELALMKPANLHVRSLVLCATTPGKPSGVLSQKFLETFQPWDEESARVDIALSFLKQGLPEKWVSKRRTFLSKIATAFAETARESSAIEGQARAVDAFGTGGNLRLAQLPPSLVIHGDADEIMPPENAMELASTLGTASKLDIWKGCGHLLYLQEPRRFVQTVADFLHRAEVEHIA